MNFFLLCAAGLSALTWGVHTFVGGPTVAGPLLASGIDPMAKHTNYYCWHLVTIVLAGMALAYVYAAFVPSARDVAVFVTMLAAAFGLWSLGLTVWKRRPLSELPQWTLFGAISLAAGAGLF